MSSKQADSNKHKNENQMQSIIEASNTETLINSGNDGLNVSTDTIADVDVSDLADMSSNAVHHETCNNPSIHKNLFQDSVRNEMLTHYNKIVIGSFKEFFQSVNMNNLAEVLQALNCNTAYNPEHSIRGRPHSRGNQYHWYSQQSSPLLRYNQHSERSDTCFHSNRNYGNIHHCIISQCNSPHTVRNTPNTSNNQTNAIITHSQNNSDIIRCLQSQNLGLQVQVLQQSLLNSIKIFNGNNKSEFTSWAQIVENAAKLCNLNTLSITLSKLQGPPVKSAHFLESKEVSSGKQLDWHSLKKHLITNYSEIPYDTHAINVYDNLHQGSNESTSTFFHRVQDILERIHHTSDMTSISAISTNHAKILTGLKDGRLRNKLAESKTKNGLPCPRFCRT